MFTNVDNLDSFVVLQELQRDGHVLEFLVAERRTFVELEEPLAGQDFDECDQPQTIRKVILEVSDVLIDSLEMFVCPACEAVLLDQLPLGVTSQLAFRCVRVHDALREGPPPSDGSADLGEVVYEMKRRIATCSITRDAPYLSLSLSLLSKDFTQ